MPTGCSPTASPPPASAAASSTSTAPPNASTSPPFTTPAASPCDWQLNKIAVNRHSVTSAIDSQSNDPPSRSRNQMKIACQIARALLAVLPLITFAEEFGVSRAAAAPQGGGQPEDPRKSLSLFEIERARPGTDPDGAIWKIKIAPAELSTRVFGQPSRFAFVHDEIATPFENCLLRRRMSDGAQMIPWRPFRFPAPVSQVFGHGIGAICIVEGAKD